MYEFIINPTSTGLYQVVRVDEAYACNVIETFESKADAEVYRNAISRIHAALDTITVVNS